MPKLRYSEKLAPVILVVLMLASRIPLVTSYFFKADGDESIVGLMAKEIVDHGDFKVYFWGQQYGFVTFETTVAAGAFELFGMNAWALKISMLLLWVAGALLLYEALKRISGARVAFVFALLLAVCPAWGLWSMKARGGYITAWFFSGIAAWVLSALFTRPDEKKYALWMLLGICITIVYYGQKLWLFSLLPFIALVFIKRANIPKLLFLLVPLAFSFWLVHFAARHEVSNYWTYDGDVQFNILHNIHRIIPRLQRHFSGSYFIGREFFAGTINSIAASLWLSILAVFAMLQVYRLAARRFYPLSHLMFIAVCLSAVSLFSTDEDRFNFRYLLPLDVPLLIGFALEGCYWVDKLKWKAIMGYGLAAFACFNFIGMAQLRNIGTEMMYEKPTLSFSESMHQALDYCTQHGIYYTFSSDPYIFWETDFYSQKKVMSRFVVSGDRNPTYVNAVTRAYLDGKPTAILNTYYATEFNPRSPAPGIDIKNVVSFGKQIRVYPNPSRMTLDSIGFDLKVK